jgi:hypothetical protein
LQHGLSVDLLGVERGDPGFQGFVAWISQREVNLVGRQRTRRTGGIDVQPRIASLPGESQRPAGRRDHRLGLCARRIQSCDLGLLGKREQCPTTVRPCAAAELQPRSRGKRTLCRHVRSGDVEEQFAVHARPQHFQRRSQIGFGGEPADGSPDRLVVDQSHVACQD